MFLRVDAETHGYNKEYEKAEELIKAVVGELDENVIEVSIKKRAVKDNSRNHGETKEFP